MPTGSDWLCEIKFDGYRVMCRIDKGEVRLITRGGHDWTERMTSLVAQIEAMGVGSAWLDGEIVVMNAAGVPDFNALQNAFDSSRTEQIICYLFDVPFFEGYDLRKVPLQDRRRLLRQLIEHKGSDRVRFSEDFPGDVASVLDNVCRLQLEGVIAKRRDAPYVSRRTETWLKLKCGQRQEFVDRRLRRPQRRDGRGRQPAARRLRQGQAGLCRQRRHRLGRQDRPRAARAS